MKTYILFLTLAISVFASCKSDGQTNPDPKPVEEELDGDPDIGDLTLPGTVYDKFET